MGNLDVHVTLVEIEQAECRADAAAVNRHERLAHRIDESSGATARRISSAVMTRTGGFLVRSGRSSRPARYVFEDPVEITEVDTGV